MRIPVRELGGRAAALAAGAALLTAGFLPWDQRGRVAVDLGPGGGPGWPSVGVLLVALAAVPMLAALGGDRGWPRLASGAAAGALVLGWLAGGPDGSLRIGVVLTLAASVGLLLAAALATGERDDASGGPR